MTDRPTTIDELVDWYRARDATWKAFVEFIAACRSDGSRHLAQAAQAKLKEMERDGHR